MSNHPLTFVGENLLKISSDNSNSLVLPTLTCLCGGGEAGGVPDKKDNFLILRNPSSMMAGLRDEQTQPNGMAEMSPQQMEGQNDEAL